MIHLHLSIDLELGKKEGKEGKRREIGRDDGKRGRWG